MFQDEANIFQLFRKEIKQDFAAPKGLYHSRCMSNETIAAIKKQNNFSCLKVVLQKNQKESTALSHKQFSSLQKYNDQKENLNDKTEVVETESRSISTLMEIIVSLENVNDGISAPKEKTFITAH